MFLDGEDVTSLVRTPEVDRIVSPVSLPEEVRKSMGLETEGDSWQVRCRYGRKGYRDGGHT